jgi:hypothetical protein
MSNVGEVEGWSRSTNVKLGVPMIIELTIGEIL